MQQKTTWAPDAFIYHIYPLGLCGAPARNEFSQSPQDRLSQLYTWGDHAQALGCNTIYIGPLFESTAHGYDTADYYTIDRRLGTNQGFQALSAYWHQQGLRLVLDGVFHHVGRDFWAFQDLQRQGVDSPYRHWFSGIDFNRRSAYDDAFYYEGWNNHYDLVKLNLAQPDVRAHLFRAVAMWIDEFGIDGLRLDAADVMDLNFLEALTQFCRQKKADFWLLGEVIHGDYRRWANPALLDATTNYECFKGLYSSHNDQNYFEIAYSLNRQFGPDGLYQDVVLYTFADNHDVDRLASTLHDPAHLYPLHILLFTIPGIPSLYYGSEWGVAGRKHAGDDSPLRPALGLPFVHPPHPDLITAIQVLASLRQTCSALRHGSYGQVLVNSQQFAFLRAGQDESILVVVNSAYEEVSLLLPLNLEGIYVGIDLLNRNRIYGVQNGYLQLSVPASWGCIIQLNRHS